LRKRVVQMITQPSALEPEQGISGTLTQQQIDDVGAFVVKKITHGH
jgi:hypothetical protein